MLVTYMYVHYTYEFVMMPITFVVNFIISGSDT